MIQKINIKESPLLIFGGGRIDESQPIDLLEYVDDTPPNGGVPIAGFVPGKFCISKQIGKTVYDVTGCFDTESKQSLLQQFKTLILSTPQI